MTKLYMTVKANDGVIEVIEDFDDVLSRMFPVVQPSPAEARKSLTFTNAQTGTRIFVGGQWVLAVEEDDDSES